MTALRSRIYFIFLLLALSGLASAQQGSITDLSFELQVYPTGIIPGVRWEKAYSGKHAINARVGVQKIRHQDYGVHDDERGDGFGFSLGYRRYLQPGYKGLSLNLRADVWFNQLDWKDNISQVNEINGNTHVTVLQPTIGAGYLFELGNNINIRPTVSVGYEINVETQGESVGEGLIWLIGFEVGRRLR